MLVFVLDFVFIVKRDRRNNVYFSLDEIFCNLGFVFVCKVYSFDKLFFCSNVID